MTRHGSGGASGSAGAGARRGSGVGGDTASRQGNVVHVVVAGEVGGAERMLVDLARGDTGRSHSVALLTPSPRLRELFREAGLFVDDRGPVREGPLTYIARSLGPRDVAWVSDVLSRRKATIAHLHTFGSQVLGTRAARRIGARVVRTEHSTRVYDDPSCWPFSRWSLRRADASVCISEHVKDVALAKAPWAAAKLRVVPNGIDLEHFAEAPFVARREGARVKFVAVGRCDARKGFDIALRALAEVPGAELEIVGDGDEREKLQTLARELGIADLVHFAGFCTDVRQAIANADLALSSARSEGLGIALLEAMAMGRAVVALPTGGVPEFVRDGETGWLARGADVPALVRVMRDAVANREALQTRGERARALVQARFSLDAMRAGYEAVYASLDAR